MSNQKYVMVPMKPTPEWVANLRNIRIGSMESVIEDVLAAAPAVQEEPVAGGPLHPSQVRALRRNVKRNCPPEIYALLDQAITAPQPAEQQPEYGDAYQGARTDVAIWKRRALEAEQRVREQDQIIDRMGEDLNAINGPTFMGEPVLPKKQPEPDVAQLVEALRMLAAAGNRLNDEAEECMYDDGMAEVAGADYWGKFRDALEEATAALATHQKREGSDDSR